MREVFADTYYFLALLGIGDAGHSRAVAMSRTARKRGWRLVTTGWVLTELGDALCLPADRPAFVRTVTAVRSDESFEVVSMTGALFNSGFDFFKTRPDQEWSFTDCISFVVMKERGITDALTGDHHFEQAGFTALLK
ncbi:MAG TPA: PIN domain-containing protein [Planctomycetota bacterium]|jgi:hypothetical protein